MSIIPPPPEIYKHFKGNLYQITAVAEHTETGETLVVYQAMYGDFKTYARPLDMFVSRVDREKYPDAGQEFRFELQGPDAARQRSETGAMPEVPGQRLETGAVPDAAGQRSKTGAGSDIAGQRPETGAVPDAAGQRPETGQALKVSGWEPAPKDGGEFTEGELALDPMVLEFLDADSYEQRLNILAGLHHRITDEMITTMAIACDVEIDNGETEERYEALKNCLITLERYECQRIR